MTTIHSDASVFHWRPQFIHLTLLPQPGILEEGSTSCFVDPGQIISIRRAWIKYKEQTELNRAGTAVVIYGGGELHVEESPEEVARRRDNALGHEPPKPKAVS